MKKKFCEKCGTELINRVCPKCSQNESINADDYERKIKSLFMSPNEKIAAVLGKAYSEKYLQKNKIFGGFAVASDKRLYFFGESYDICNNVFGRKKLRENNQSKTIDLKDVTGTGSGSYRNIHWLNATIVFFVLIIICSIINALMVFVSILSGRHYLGEIAKAIFQTLLFPVIPMLFLFMLIYLIAYITQKLHMLTFQYNGGELAFNMTGIAEEEIVFFKSQFCLAKDKTTENNIEKSSGKEAALSVTQSTPRNSKTDELVKLADLLSKGVISQEEFEKMKREIIL